MGMKRKFTKSILNKPFPSWRKNKLMAVYVWNNKTHRPKLIHFGDPNYKQNHSQQARKNYLARSAGIRNKKGNLTKNNKLSANYWARKFLWGAR